QPLLDDGVQRITHRDYDTAGRLKQITLPDPDGSGTDHPKPAPITIYGYDAVANITSVVNNFGYLSATEQAAFRYSYQYDLLNRKTKETAPSVPVPAADGSVTMQSPITSYLYDVAGDLVAMTEPRGTTLNYQYDEM